MKKIKDLYDVVAKDAKSGKEAYEMVNDYITDYASIQLKERNIEDIVCLEDLCIKLFGEEFDDYGNLTEEEAYTYVSNIIDNELILANYRKTQEEIMFE